MTRFTESDKEMSSRLGLWRVLVPVAIGLCVVVWLFYREFDPEVWHTVHFTNRVIWGIPWRGCSCWGVTSVIVGDSGC